MLKRALLSSAVIMMLLSPVAGAARDGSPAVRIVMSPASTVPKADLVKDLMYKCPNVTITLDSKQSDYMLEAARWPNGYKFTLFKKGGDAAFSTSTVLLSNAVKDVCHFVNMAH